MQMLFTEEDLVRYIYGEMEPAEICALEEQLSANESLHLAYLQLKEASLRLDSFSATPHPSTIELILERSREEELMM